MLIDPADVDWTDHDDVNLELAAKSGIPQAIAECKRRGLTYAHAEAAYHMPGPHHTGH